MGKQDKLNSAQRKSGASHTESINAESSRDGSNISSSAPLKLQQHVLNIFKDACEEALGDDSQAAIQEVKQHLYERDFAKAFGSQRNLWAYAARWSPSRALAYLQIFSDISPLVTAAAQVQASEPAEEIDRPELRSEKEPAAASSAPPQPVPFGPTRPPPPSVEVGSKYEIVVLPPAYDADQAVPAYENPPAYGTNVDTLPSGIQDKSNFRITCLGGGAGAELVAAAAWLRLQSEGADEPDAYDGMAPVDAESLDVYCLDSADWLEVVSRLDEHIKTPPKLSEYASAARRSANVALLPTDAMNSLPIRQDLLDANLDCLRPLCQASSMITIGFTLNELYSTSVSKTQRLLFEITVATRPGTLLLVVDSPGSYSTVTLNGTEKKYPMQWLLDHTLLEASKNTRVLPRSNHWEKVLTDDSRWFRLPKGLVYPIELENMRYQIHLYRRLGVAADPAEGNTGRPT